ncbi:hypothetical protein DEAC_c43450 [Desulfosporosinus acididurans]|uniref:Uncharacterized protein n=1 Tax=Desulfosporosinus acididurans TaxID=476652 RepID=A0A0J1FJY5_9FIRM|nr:hypothetical protein [Desulfosporosinus acididurans]KLU63742.1 hypothetical protein DEAC_c43450 [Desulfosporosinus acididurans]
MEQKRPLGLILIGSFYIFGAFVLILTLFTNATEQFGIAVRFGLPNVPENIMKVFVSIISLVMAYGYLELKKWGYWFSIVFNIYFLIVSISLYLQYSQQYGQYGRQPFLGNALWSIAVLIYTLKIKHFLKKGFVV